MWARRVSMAQRRSSKASRLKISASGARFSTSTPSGTATASHASLRAQHIPQLYSKVVRVARGYYSLATVAKKAGRTLAPASDAESDDTGLINAFGMFWTRAQVQWSGTPRLLGQQQPGSSPVDFAGQRGVYLLHDGRQVVYVGRTTDQPLGVRLRQHTVDRLNGRWDRFSWFGVFAPSEDGSLTTSSQPRYDLEMLITTMEALLIEGLEPPQNRKRGDDFKAVEFLQVEDPEIHKGRIMQLMESLKTKL
ncbi:MAG: GIY-YIG nuclease family protein [Polyangia bacterium]